MTRDKTTLARLTERKHGKVDQSLVVEAGKETQRPEIILAADAGRTRVFNLNEKVVWVDIWEINRLWKDYKQLERRDTRLAVARLEEAYRLAQATATTHNDGLASSRIRLLGARGDEYSWEDLEGQRENAVDVRYNLNKLLADYYLGLSQESQNETETEGSKAGLTNFGWSVERAWEHYAQCHLVRPTWAELVLALMQLAHGHNDLATLRSVFNDYKLSCKREGWRVEKEVQAKYDSYCLALGERCSKRAGSSGNKKTSKPPSPAATNPNSQADEGKRRKVSTR